jgi:hypothetical protein
MGAFVISPLPPVLLESLQTAGPLRSADVTPLPRYYRPSRIPLAIYRFPGVAGYTASLLRRFLDGTRRVSPVARHDLVTVLSLPTPPKCFAASALATLHAAFAREVRARPSGFSTFEALWVYLRYGPVTRSPSLLDGFVNRLQDSQFPSFLLFKLRGLSSYPDGTFTHCSCPPSLDAHFPLLISCWLDRTTARADTTPGRLHSVLRWVPDRSGTQGHRGNTGPFQCQSLRTPR